MLPIKLGLLHHWSELLKNSRYILGASFRGISNLVRISGALPARRCNLPSTRCRRCSSLFGPVKAQRFALSQWVFLCHLWCHLWCHPECLSMNESQPLQSAMSDPNFHPNIFLRFPGHWRNRTGKRSGHLKNGGFLWDFQVDRARWGEKRWPQNNNHPSNKRGRIPPLGGGFQHFIFSPFSPRTLGKISNLTNIFQVGWNHQLVPCFLIEGLLDVWLKLIQVTTCSPYRALNRYKAEVSLGYSTTLKQGIKSVRLIWPPKCGEKARDLKITSESSACGWKTKNGHGHRQKQSWTHWAARRTRWT